MLGTMVLVVGFSMVATNKNVHVLSFLVGNRTTETLDSGYTDMNCSWQYSLERLWKSYGQKEVAIGLVSMQQLLTVRN